MNKFIFAIKQINKFIKSIWQLIISTSNATLEVTLPRPCPYPLSISMPDECLFLFIPINIMYIYTHIYINIYICINIFGQGHFAELHSRDMTAFTSTNV